MGLDLSTLGGALGLGADRVARLLAEEINAAAVAAGRSPRPAESSPPSADAGDPEPSASGSPESASAGGAPAARPRVLVIGHDLGRSLAAHLDVVAVLPPRKRRKRGPPAIVASPTALPFAAHTLAAVCLGGLPQEGLAALRESARVVRDGGVVAVAVASSALLRRGAPPEVMAALFLHAGLVDVEQRQLGATAITTGRVRLA